MTITSILIAHAVATHFGNAQLGTETPTPVEVPAPTSVPAPSSAPTAGPAPAPTSAPPQAPQPAPVPTLPVNVPPKVTPQVLQPLDELPVKSAQPANLPPTVAPSSADLVKSWGLAPCVLYTRSLGGERVNRANVDAAGIVRVDRDASNRLRWGVSGQIIVKRWNRVGLGIAGVLVPASDVTDLVDAAGIGITVQFEEQGIKRLNLVAGVAMERATELGDGVTAGEHLLMGDSLRYREGVGPSVFVGLSYTLWGK